MTIFYKVRNKKDGTFLKGSKHGYAEFTKNGKAFNSIGNINSSLSPRHHGGTLRDGLTYDDLEVITYETVEIKKEDFKPKW